MRFEVKLPSLGDEGIESVSVSQWMVNEGQSVRKGDDLIELTTDKAAFVLPVPKDGTVTERLVSDGDEVAVGDVLCILEY